VVLSHGQIARIDGIEATGDQLALGAEAVYARGGLNSVRIDRLMLGRTVGDGLVRFPSGAGPIAVSLSGPVLDLSGRLDATPSGVRPAPQNAGVAKTPAGPAWIADARFGQVILAAGQRARAVALHAENDGQVFQRLHLFGRTAADAPFEAEIAPSADGRTLQVSASDAGSLLRGLALGGSVEGGRLAINGRYDDRLPAHPLAGSAEMDAFSIRAAPAFGKLLQAMTLYGLVDALSGPGVVFTRMVTPFRFADDVLDVTQARAFSSSLGLTAQGQIDFRTQTADMRGTIVPAYFLNTMLGHLPVMGRLFSPEKGGGVFAAKFALRGPLANPTVRVNPLSALTPGFLRDLFGKS
jgi:hypothetical protein